MIGDVWLIVSVGCGILAMSICIHNETRMTTACTVGIGFAMAWPIALAIAVLLAPTALVLAWRNRLI